MEDSEYYRTYRLETEHWWFVSRRQLAATLLEQRLMPQPNRRILDAGCGTGGNINMLKKWGRVTGVDLQALPLDLARGQGSSLAKASTTFLPFANHTFGLITVFDVLYHQWVVDDCQAIAEFYRVLQPGGWLLITDSALPLLWSAHDRVYFARQRYTIANLRHKLTANGFELRLASYINSLLLPLTLAVRLMIRRLSMPADFDMQPLPLPLNRLFIAIRRMETAWLSRGRTLPAGSSIVCLAQKPKQKDGE
jgi:ubiquinone/menaquinone biosynthesis C-methylase UbiE